MRQILLLILVLISCSRTNDQKIDEFTSVSVELSDFEKFIDHMKQKHKPIPDDYLIKYLEVDSVQLSYGRFTTNNYVQFSEDIYGIIYQFDCYAGGFCQTFTLSTFKNQKLMDNLKIEHTYYENLNSEYLNYQIDSNKIILTQKTSELDEETEQETIIKQSTETYKVDLSTGLISRK